MKRAPIFASAAIALVGRIALAQAGDDPMTQLRACSLMERADRLECLDKLSRTLVPKTPPTPKESRWIVSQTRSPVDYSPISTATIWSRELADGGAMQLSIHCRAGRIEIAIAGPTLSGSGNEYAISYRINDGPPVQIAAATPASGEGVALKADAVALIQSLPADGQFAVHLSPHVGAPQDAIFSLVGLETVRAKIAASCKWPHAITRSKN